MSETLYALTTELVDATHALKEMAEAGEIDAQALADTLEAVQLPVQHKALQVAAYSRHLEAQMVTLMQEEDRLANYRRYLQRQADALRQYLHDQMVRAGITKIEAVAGAPPFRLAIRKNPPRVVVDNEGALPWEFKREVVKTEVDKALIRDALKQGLSVPGAHLEQSERVEIK